MKASVTIRQFSSDECKSFMSVIDSHGLVGVSTHASIYYKERTALYSDTTSAQFAFIQFDDNEAKLNWEAKHPSYIVIWDK